MPEHDVWLAWALAFLAGWVGLYVAFPGLRTVMWRVGAFTALFGFTEPLFVGRYWDPPSLFDLARRTGLDVESFLFCFAIGGVAAVLFNAVTGRPIRIPPKARAQGRWQQGYVFAFLFPFLFYLPLQGVLGRPLWAGAALMFAGAVVRAALFPELRAKTLAGGPLFLLYYVAYLALLRWLAPAGYIGRVWLAAIPGGRAWGVPWAELSFGLTVGMFWSGAYEQVAWIFTLPKPPARNG